MGMANVPDEHLLIDVDKAGLSGSQSKCDYIFIGCGEVTWVVALELKRGNPKASTVVRQLRAGAEYVDCIIPERAKVEFRPVVFSGKLHPAERVKLRRKENRVRFRGDNQYIVPRECGDPLTSVLTRPLEEER